MSTWAARAKLHLSNKGQKVSAISDETPHLSLMAPHFGALCEKRESANDPAPTPKTAAADVDLIPQHGEEVSTTAAIDPDRHCWPHSAAMNGTEIDAFNARVIRFTGKGASHIDGEALADKLVQRDRDLDDRRLCLECSHLSGFAGSWRCRAWQRAGIAINSRDAGLSDDLMHLLQRCNGFKGA